MPLISKSAVTIGAVVLVGFVVTQSRENTQLKRVTAGSLRLRVPESWERVRTASRADVVRFQLRGSESGSQIADFSVYFSRSATAGVQVTVPRWIGQFQEAGRKVELKYGRWPFGDYVLADISGTWKKEAGDGRVTNVADSRVIGVVLMKRTRTAQDQYLLVLSGPDSLVKSQAAAVRASFGADLASERPYKMNDDKVVRSEAEWKKLLTAEQFRILRLKGTERAFTNKYDKHFVEGVYSCAACGQELFSSTTKFNSGCGWPAFYAAQAGDRVNLTRDFSHGMVRTEVTCARCDSHLGHIFNDAPQTPTGQRYCINSVSLKFTPKKQGSEKRRDK